jgi:hypothetical protein
MSGRLGRTRRGEQSAPLEFEEEDDDDFVVSKVDTDYIAQLPQLRRRYLERRVPGMDTRTRLLRLLFRLNFLLPP